MQSIEAFGSTEKFWEAAHRAASQNFSGGVIKRKAL